MRSHCILIFKFQLNCVFTRLHSAYIVRALAGRSDSDTLMKIRVSKSKVSFQTNNYIQMYTVHGYSSYSSTRLSFLYFV